MPSNPALDTLINPGVGWMLVILGFCIWLLFKPERGKISRALLAVALSWVALPTIAWFMKLESRWFPLKFDYFLYHLDLSLGLSAFSVARCFTEWQRTFLLGVYSSLVLVMLAWYVFNLQVRDGRPGPLLRAYLIMMFSGPLLYAIVPGRGPRHAFGEAFPWGHPEAPLSLVRLDGWPNAMPSLHTAMALLFVLFAGRSRIARGLAWTYLAGTVAATLAFEHYVIDLIVAVPFAFFVARTAEGRFRPALYLLLTVLSWLLAIRLATPQLVRNPCLLRALATATVVLSAGTLPFRIPGFHEAVGQVEVVPTTSTGPNRQSADLP